MVGDLMKVTIIVIMIALCGCSQKIVDKIVPENIPIPIACSPPVIMPPQWNVDRLKVDATDIARLRAMLADLELSKGYINQLKVAAASC